MPGHHSVTAGAGWAAHGLAWGAGVWLAAGPFYEGTSYTPSGAAVRHTATLVEVNGPWVLWLLSVPVVVTGLALLTLRLTRGGRRGRKVWLWGCAAASLVFWAFTSMSFGFVYLPSALALLLAAVASSRERRPTRPRGDTALEPDA